MKILKTPIKDLIIIKNKRFDDSRAYFRELLIEKKINKKFCFHVISTSQKNVIKGLHFQIQKPQGKFISVLKGKIIDVALDLRKNSKTFGKHFKIILSENKGRYLFVPKGFAHGFLGLDKENIVLYSCSNYRVSKYERNIKWNDKDLNINWGIKKPILSKRDKNAQNFSDFVKK